MEKYNCYLGGFDYEWRNPPPPFNPLFDPDAAARYAAVSASMESDGFYSGHSREQCRIEWRRRYDAIKESEHDSEMA